MIPTDLDALDVLISDTLEAMAPRKSYPGGDVWTPYVLQAVRSTGRPIPTRTGPPASGVRSRRFKLMWTGATRRREGGIWTNDVTETESELTILVDYAAKASDVAARDRVVLDDFLQILDVLCSIKGYDNGLMLVEEIRCLEEGGAEDPTIARYALVYLVRYLAAQAATG